MFSAPPKTGAACAIPRGGRAVALSPGRTTGTGNQSADGAHGMPISLEHERDNVFRLDVRGMLRQTEFEECQQRLSSELARTGSARLLFVLDGFEGWDPQGRWDDLSYFANYGDRIERIAIVGPERWRSETLMFAGVRRAPVSFFVDGAIADARAWLAA